MGWWENHGKIWGDGPADIMDEALDKIAAEFRSEWKRDPTYAELEAGIRFAVWDRLNVPDSIKAEKTERGRFSLTGEAGYAGFIACDHCTWQSTRRRDNQAEAASHSRLRPQRMRVPDGTHGRLA